MRSIVVLPIKAYQRAVSPALPRSCKYHPSCSQYAVEAVSGYGVARGLVLAGWRVLRCNPLSDGGFDPVERQRLFRRSPAMGPSSKTGPATVLGLGPSSPVQPPVELSSLAELSSVIDKVVTS